MSAKYKTARQTTADVMSLMAASFPAPCNSGKFKQSKRILLRKGNLYSMFFHKNVVETEDIGGLFGVPSHEQRHNHIGYINGGVKAADRRALRAEQLLSYPL